MDAEWVEFEMSPVPHSKGPYVSLNSKDEFVLNRHVWEDLGKPDAVALFFDPKTSRVGMRPASPHLPNAFPVRPVKSGRNYIVYARMFARRWDIITTGTVRFPQPEIVDGMLVLALKERIAVTRRYKTGDNSH